ncbi:Kae1-associated serine/threonine protein kinase [Candidatus Woesearchaeota archaeon]|nr:Kae1-associated serine/threonine protein kinase [Candidatus Woesearchaeota archaeon]
MENKVIGSGAEAVIYKKDESVVKDRIKKSYRHPQIDRNLRKLRTRREAKILSKLKEIGFPSPVLMDFDDSRMTVVMEYIYGAKLRDIFHTNPKKFSREIGEKMAILHNNGIIHHDLTTSNMILRGKEIHFIDFGLSFFSEKAEDMAVDIHLLDRAMESRHHEHYPECFNEAVKAYAKKADAGKEVLARFRKVNLRGRNKAKH